MNNLTTRGLLNKKNPKDVFYMLMVERVDDMRDVSALIFENYIHTKALAKHGKYEYINRHSLRDFEINGVKIYGTKNLRIRGGHVKISSYQATCQADLKEFKSEVMSSIDSQIIKNASLVIAKKKMADFLINTNFIICIAKSIDMVISDYRAMSAAYFMRYKKRFDLTQDHIDYMKQIYLTVCEQLLNNSMTMNKNIPNPISLIYIAMRQNDVTKYKELKDFLMTLPISVSSSKIADISNGIFYNGDYLNMSS